LLLGTTDSEGVLIRSYLLGSMSSILRSLVILLMEVVLVKESVALSFVMLPEMNQLQNVVITSRPKIMRIKETLFL
jgi:hypothetical protein